MTTAAIRNKLYDYIRTADDKKLHAIYNLLENEIEQVAEWWKDEHIIAELDARYNAMKTGSDKGVTVDQLQDNVSKARVKKYGA